MTEVLYMKNKLTCLLLTALITASAASCSSKEDSDSSSAGGSPIISAEDADLEPAVIANSGDAYLAIIDGQWWVQYWGSTGEKNQLAYKAGVVPITGNGDYTVSVTADSNGFRFETANDPDTQILPSGLNFMSVMIKDGEKLFPNAVITVNAVKVDGKELELSAKAYTSSDDGAETRANIYNTWVSKPASDGRCAEGALYNGDAPADYCSQYSAQIVDPQNFAEWTTVEVDFTVSGIAE